MTPWMFSSAYWYWHAYSILTHDATTVYVFSNIINENLPHVTHIKYCADGSSAQQKNYMYIYKNFYNMCHHEEDFKLTCEWNFFWTPHSKGPCNGIGGVVKWRATRYSKQLVRSGKGRLLNPEQLHQYAEENIQGVKYVSIEHFHRFYRTDITKCFMRLVVVTKTILHLSPTHLSWLTNYWSFHVKRTYLKAIW
jgi:hypothetical protein